MAVEAKRGCGYRKIGGLYLVTDGKGIACDRLPIELSICPCCGGGIKPARGWTWVETMKLFGGNHHPCQCKAGPACPACFPAVILGGKAGLLWVGEKFYTVESFMAEGAAMGISRRISCLPRGFKVGETWIFMAHRKCFQRPKEGSETDILGQATEMEDIAGIFTAIRPSRIERIVKESEFKFWSAMVHDYEKDGLAREDWKKAWAAEYDDGQNEILHRLGRDVDRGITLVPVPDDDPDHQ